MESELFGYERGAFTSANCNSKFGLFQVPDKGTIFCEISELPLLMQDNLLRALQKQEIIPVGSIRPREIDVKVIAATNRNLEEMVQHNLLRKDLYHRINVFPILVAPLREKWNDIIPLSKAFLKKLNRRYNCRKEFCPDVLNLLCKYEWPKNIRELKNVIEQAFINKEGSITSADSLSFAGDRINADLDVAFRKQPNESLDDFLARVEDSGFIELHYRILNQDGAIALNKACVEIEKYLPLRQQPFLLGGVLNGGSGMGMEDHTEPVLFPDKLVARQDARIDAVPHVPIPGPLPLKAGLISGAVHYDHIPHLQPGQPLGQLPHSFPAFRCGQRSKRKCRRTGTGSQAVVIQLPDRLGPDVGSVLENGDPVRNLKYLVNFMRDGDNGDAPALQLRNKGEQFLHFLRRSPPLPRGPLPAQRRWTHRPGP